MHNFVGLLKTCRKITKKQKMLGVRKFLRYNETALPFTNMNRLGLKTLNNFLKLREIVIKFFNYHLRRPLSSW